MRPPIIELAGLPGSGKSSLCAYLPARYNLGFRHVSLRELTSAGTLITAVRATALPFLAQARRMPSRRCYRYKIMVQLHAHHCGLRRMHVDGRVLMLDQGPVYLLSILERALRNDGADSTAFRRYWEAALERWAHTLDLIVVMDAPNDELFRRIQNRGSRHRLFGRSIQDAVRSFEAGRRHRAGILDALAERNPSIRILNVPTAGISLEYIGRTVVSEIERIRAISAAANPAIDHDPAATRQ